MMSAFHCNAVQSPTKHGMWAGLFVFATATKCWFTECRRDVVWPVGMESGGEEPSLGMKSFCGEQLLTLNFQEGRRPPSFLSTFSFSFHYFLSWRVTLFLSVKLIVLKLLFLSPSLIPCPLSLSTYFPFPPWCPTPPYNTLLLSLSLLLPPFSLSWWRGWKAGQDRGDGGLPPSPFVVHLSPWSLCRFPDRLNLATPHPWCLTFPYTPPQSQVWTLKIEEDWEEKKNSSAFCTSVVMMV